MIFRKSFTFLVAFSLVLFLAVPRSFADVEILGNEISGTINQSGSYSQIDGNRNFTFVDDGPHYNTDTLTQIKKQIAPDWKWDMDLRVRKTDDHEVDERTSVHLLQLSTRLLGRNSMFQFGDFYTRFTDLTFNRAIEGFNYQTEYKKVGTQLNMIAGRQYLGQDFIQNTRYVYGGHVNQNIISKKFFIINKWDIGGSFVQTFDDPRSIGQHFGVPQMNNILGGFNTHVQVIEDLNVDIELNKSLTNDRANILQQGDTLGYAFSLRSNYFKKTKFGTSFLNFDYERVMPGYQALSGSVVPDREAFYVGWTQRFNPKMTLNSAFRALRDNLNDTAFTTTRTYNPRFSLNIVPIEHIPDLIVTPYVDYRKQNTSNGLIDNNNVLTGVDIEKKVWYGIIVNGGYDLIRRLDDASTSDETANSWHIGVRHRWSNEHISLSPYFRWDYRTEDFDDVATTDIYRNFQWGLQSEFYKKFRVYFNYGFGSDERTFQLTDTNQYSWNVNAEYDLLNNLMLVMGWRQYVQHFATDTNTFGENVGSVRLQYKY